MATKANSKLCQASEIELFRKTLLASEANSESCQISKMELFSVTVIPLMGYFGFLPVAWLICLPLKLH